MKVCFVTHDFDFFMIHIFHLVREISKYHEVTVITDIENIPRKDLRKLESKKINIKSLRKRDNSNIFSYLRYIGRLKNLKNRINPDYIFYITLEISLFGSIISKYGSGQKSYFVISGLGPDFFKEKLSFKILYFFYHIIFKINLLKKDSFFIFQNSDDHNLFLDRGLCTKNKSILIGGFGVKLNKQKRAYSKSEIKFCFAGRLEKSKGITELLDATKNLSNKYTNFRLIIAGNYTTGKRDSISESDLQTLNNHRLIQYLGKIPHHEMNDLYQRTDVFVLPSYREGLSRAALEAASNGMALIVSDVPGCRECIDENGLLVKTRDSLDLAEKMEFFIKNHDAVKTLGENSIKNIAEKYSLDKISKKYLDLIN